MTKKPLKIACGIAVAGSFLFANYASQHAWPLWSITIAGAVFVGAVVTYLIAAQAS